MEPIPKARIAVVEDDDSIRETVGYGLEQEGYQVDSYDEGAMAWEAIRRELPDLAILDILLPRMDGLELCRRLRSVSEVLPIIFLTSKDEEVDRILGLELGADDYLCKPFSMRELIARVRVLLRRVALMREDAPQKAREQVVRGALMLDLDQFRASWAGVPVTLTVTEFRILHALVRRPGHVKSREQLIQEGYPEDRYLSDRTIDSHIKRLRRKLQDTDQNFSAIETVYGLGYRWKTQ